MVEAYRRDASSKDQLINELKSTKKRLLAEVKDLKQEVLSFQGEKQSAELEQARLAKEVVRVQGQMNHMEAHLQTIQEERDQLENQIQVIIHICSMFHIKCTIQSTSIVNVVGKVVSRYSVNPLVM